MLYYGTGINEIFKKNKPKNRLLAGLSITNNIQSKPMACQCKEDQHPIHDDVTGEIICKDCGVVLESNTTGYSESNEKNTLHLHDYGIGTEPTRMRLAHPASQKIASSESASNSKTRGLFMMINPILQNISATTQIKNDAFSIARKCVAKKITHGRVGKNIAVACVMISCKTNGRMISEKELLKISNAPKKGTRKAYRIILERLSISTIPVSKRTEMTICKICSDLKLSTSIRDRSIEMLSRYSSVRAGANPNNVAGAMIYIASDMRRTQNEIAEKAGVTVVALHTLHKKLKKRMQETRISRQKTAPCQNNAICTQKK